LSSISPEPVPDSRVCPPDSFRESVMRDDMGKVLVERPRVRAGFVQGKCGKGYLKYVARGLASDDGLPRSEGTKRRYPGHRQKHFNEHLGPLRKFVESNVGRPWDKVYAEICRHVDRGNVVQKHILTHLFQYVVVDVELIAGEPYRKPGQGWYRYGVLRGPNQWYVCPKSGLLKRAKVEPKPQRRARWQPERKAEPPVGWVDSDRCVCRSADGRWLLVRVRKWVPVAEQPGPRRLMPQDVLLSDSDPNRLEHYYGKRVYAVDVRLLGEAELEDLPVTLPGNLTSPNVVRCGR
jgi:hypothetical protein